MTAHRSNKIRIYPTAEQEAVLLQRMGASRFVYNWALARWQAMYAAGEKPTPNGLAKQFRTERPEWFFAMDAEIIDRATANLGAAFRGFFAKQARYPQFKRKGERDSYQVKATSYAIGCGGIRIPKCAPIVMARPLFHDGERVGNLTISIQAGRWYASVPVICEAPSAASSTSDVVGIDLGLKTFATLSNGVTVGNPRFLRRAERRLKLSHRRLSRAKRGSANREKARARMARRHATVANKRKHFLHQTTTGIARTYAAVSIEDLNTSGMKRSKLAKSVSDASLREFRRQLEYKMPGRVLVVDRFYPSSKTCSACGVVRAKLTLRERSWTCEQCGAVHDRDLNAAINLVRAFHPEFTPVEIGALRPVDDAGTN